ncbi:MAG TPA: DUF3465 domain-containing protein [Chloroflexota bacterium]|nr:DUF3465 domain-containing protein [Chloroflexota bacterium]
MFRSNTLIAILVLVLLAGGIAYLRISRRSESVAGATQAARIGCTAVEDAFRAHRSGVWLTLGARVQRTLPDEQGTYRHQRFITVCPDGRTVLIVNDVSIGQRVPVVDGATVGVRGQYVWNALGGLVHFTHHDPQGAAGGWILFRSRLYSFTARQPPADEDVFAQTLNRRAVDLDSA